MHDSALHYGARNRSGVQTRRTEIASRNPSRERAPSPPGPIAIRFSDCKVQAAIVADREPSLGPRPETTEL